MVEVTGLFECDERHDMCMHVNSMLHWQHALLERQATPVQLLLFCLAGLQCV